MIKEWLSNTLYYSGFLKLVSWTNNRLKKRGTIVVFHRVTPQKKGLPTLFIKPETFAKVIDYLHSHYHILSLSEYTDYVRSGMPLPDRSLVISFDDGYRDSFIHAFPVLREHGLPFMMFVPAKILNGGVDFWWDSAFCYCQHLESGQISSALRHVGLPVTILDYLQRELKRYPLSESRSLAVIGMLEKLPANLRSVAIDALRQALPYPVKVESGRVVINLDEIREMERHGGEIGSHTKTHCFLDTVTAREAFTEIHESKTMLENILGGKIRHFAYPAGRWSPVLRQLVEQSRYESACCSEEGINRDNGDILTLKRMNLSESLVTDDNGRFIVSLLAARLTLAGAIAGWHSFWQHLRFKRQGM